MSNRKRTSAKLAAKPIPPPLIMVTQATDGRLHVIVGLRPDHLRVIAIGGLMEFGTGSIGEIPDLSIQLIKEADMREAMTEIAAERPEFAAKAEMRVWPSGELN